MWKPSIFGLLSNSSHNLIAVASFERWAEAPIFRDHGCLEDAGPVPQDPDGPVAVHCDGRLVLYGDRGGDALAFPGGTFLVYAGPDRELRRGRQRVRNEGKLVIPPPLLLGVRLLLLLLCGN